jgi:hypothetical protein
MAPLTLALVIVAGVLFMSRKTEELLPGERVPIPLQTANIQDLLMVRAARPAVTRQQ